MESFAQLILFLPAVAAVLVGLFQAQIGDRGAQLITTGAVSTSAVLSIIVFINQLSGGDPFVLGLLPWIQTGGFEVSWAIKVDMLTAVMLCVVTIVSAIVHVYSIGYMAEDEEELVFKPT